MEALQKKKNEDKSRKVTEPAKLEKSVKLDVSKKEGETGEGNCQC